MIDVNIKSLMHLTALVLPDMIARRTGRVLNIGSVIGFMPGPFVATYDASTAFVVHFTEALAYELRGTGVTATVSCPGVMPTEFARLAGTENARIYRKVPDNVTAVAEASYRVMLAGRTRVMPGLSNKFAARSPESLRDS